MGPMRDVKSEEVAVLVVARAGSAPLPGNAGTRGEKKRPRAEPGPFSAICDRSGYFTRTSVDLMAPPVETAV